MSHYYVTHPNIGISATVDAPTTEKARTTLLDYLERTGRINRASRQHYRKNMVAEKLRDSREVFSDIDLEYDYIEESRPVYTEPKSPMYREERVESPSPSEFELIPEELPQSVGGSGSPIQQLALSGRL